MKLVPIAAFAAFAAFQAAAEEGMWTFDNPPRDAIQQKYGVSLDSAWLDRVREATVRLETGCTGSFISGDGLILTNHHCAMDCIAQNSSEGNDLVTAGFLAGTREKELKCQEDAVSVLVGTEDVTAKVAAALKGVAPSGARRGAPRCPHEARTGVRRIVRQVQGGAAQVRARRALSGRPALALQVQAL